MNAFIIVSPGEDWNPKGAKEFQQICGSMLTTHHMRVSINGVPQNGLFMAKDPIEMDDLGVPAF